MVPETYVIDSDEDSKEIKTSEATQKSDPNSLVPVGIDDAPSPMVPNEANDISLSVKLENPERNGELSLYTLTSSDSIHSKAIVMGIETIPKTRWNLVINFEN